MLEVHSDASLSLLSMMDEVYRQSFLKRLSQIYYKKTQNKEIKIVFYTQKRL